MPIRSTSTKTFRIGELAARSGRSVHAIRWYEREGLIPGVMRDPGGRRLYSERHASWLALIDRLRRSGMSVAQMREYTALVKRGKVALREQREVLNAHRSRVMQTIAEWSEAKHLLDRKIAFYDEWLATGVRPPFEPEMPKRRHVAKRRVRATRPEAPGQR
jgi:DNA-binding transcriptional MerR regulator